jgi:3-ketoacyl-CoA synthase
MSGAAQQTTTAGGGGVSNIKHQRPRGPGRLKLCYHVAVSNAVYILLAPFVAVLALRASRLAPSDLAALRAYLLANLSLVVSLFSVASALATVYLARRPRAVYLLDFACYKPGPEHVVTRETFMGQSKEAGVFTDDNLAFQQKILERSGLGQGTYFPAAVLNSPPNPCMAEARREAEAVMFGAIDSLLAKTGVRARDIGVVVVNCSLFNPTPSLSAMVVNHYKLRGNVASYNLGGMGCSAGLISIDLAKQLLQVTNSPAITTLPTSLFSIDFAVGLSWVGVARAVQPP